MRTVAVALVALALAGSASAATGTLQGTVRRGPIQPICRVGEPCSAPAKRVAIVFRRAGRTVRVSTDAKGRYHAVLAAGTWNVTLPSRRVGMSVAPQRVRVAAGAMRTVDFDIDTGIR